MNNAKSNAREGDGVADLRARLEQTALDLVEHRQTHVAWRDWLQANPANEAVNPHAGSAEFHAGVILDYDRHLSNIREAIAAMQAMQGAEPVAFRYLRQLSRETYAWTRWLGMDELHHYGPNGDLVDGPAPEWTVEYAYAPATGAPR